MANNHRSDNLPDTRGILSGRSKLSEEEVLEIRLLYEVGSYTQRQLARLYGVTQKMIWAIVNKRAWAHLWDDYVEPAWHSRKKGAV
ncbi:hypothetical protein LCGC14_0561450 [marine sediment metagenome]|uniref:Uncharacterized protein n=1 Tax=marine sediment metagenome TaxID=412755 RepID=A0A0F9UV57_9ZZZZ